MPSLKYPLKKNEFVMDKLSKELYFVIRVDDKGKKLKRVWLRAEKDDEFMEVPFHQMNRVYIKANVNAWKVLYGEGGPDETDGEEVVTDDNPVPTADTGNDTNTKP